MDIVSSKKRAEMMAGISAVNTKPELMVRKLLHRMGFRYRLHDGNLPGKPDIVLRRYNAIIQVQGCFWHAHDCHLFKWPSTRPEFWREKLLKNAERDRENLQKLRGLGWKTLVVWECALKDKQSLPVSEVASTLNSWLINDPLDAEIGGRSLPIRGNN